jgi:hypothetical protein
MVHLIAHRLTDLSSELVRVGDCEVYPSGSGHLLEFSDLDKALGIVT